MAFQPLSQRLEANDLLGILASGFHRSNGKSWQGERNPRTCAPGRKIGHLFLRPLAELFKVTHSRLSQGRGHLPMRWQLQSAVIGEKDALEKLSKRTYLSELVGVIIREMTLLSPSYFHSSQLGIFPASDRLCIFSHFILSFVPISQRMSICYRCISSHVHEDETQSNLKNVTFPLSTSKTILPNTMTQ